MAKLEEVEGIGPKYADTLRKVGIRSTGDLLKKGETPEGRKKIVKDSGISPKLILEWVNHVDLFRIKGVGSEYADLLEAAGVDSVVELSKRVPKNLYDAMIATNAKKKLVRNTPALTKVESWIAQAKKLPRAVSH
jgi:predicted flap endonuclease-1-like 5' DNA nuclease